MKATSIETMARQMWERSGPKAVAEAARKAKELEETGDLNEARTWRRVEAALVLKKGPRET